MNGQRWYAAGLRFGCRRCGACCTGSPGYVWLQAEEAVALAGELGLGLPEFLGRLTRRVGERLSLREEADGRCVLFEHGLGCRAYAARPRQCRTWPFWPGLIASLAAWEREAASCPGMGQGELFAAEQIERLALWPGTALEPFPPALR